MNPYNFGLLTHDFDAVVLEEEKVENMDETHFVVNIDSGRTLASKNRLGEIYDIVSGKKRMRFGLALSGGFCRIFLLLWFFFESKSGAIQSMKLIMFCKMFHTDPIELNGLMNGLF